METFDKEYWLQKTDRAHWTYFNSIQDIPDVPITTLEIHTEVIVPALIRCGAIPKKDLIAGTTYDGACRNAAEAFWNGETFEIETIDCGQIVKYTVKHFEDDWKFDVFVPIGIKK